MGPGTDRPDVHAEELFVGGGADGERVELVCVEVQAGDAQPLPGLVLEGSGSLHEDARHPGREELGTHHGHL